MLLLSWEWDGGEGLRGGDGCACFSCVGMGWGRRKSCEDSVHIQGAHLSLPSSQPH